MSAADTSMERSGVLASALRWSGEMCQAGLADRPAFGMAAKPCPAHSQRLHVKAEAFAKAR